MSPLAVLYHLYGLLQSSSLWLTVPDEEKDALSERVLDATQVSDLSAEDQTLLRRGALDVSAGNSPVLTDPSDWGDWEAIDAALEDGDLGDLDTAQLAVLDRALLTVGGYGVVEEEQPDEVESPEEDAGEDPADEVKALGVDDDGWVGV